MMGGPEIDPESHDDSHLYQADGQPYWDGHPVGKDGLFRADGLPATFRDFTERYWSEPPEDWASQFSEYKNWTPRPVRWVTYDQLKAEELIQKRGQEANPEIRSTISKLKRCVPEAQVPTLDEIQVINYGLPTLNGYASRTQQGKRCIILHAGLFVILNHLSTLIELTFKDTETDAALRQSLTALAEFTGSFGRRGAVRGPLDSVLAGTLEHAEAGLDIAMALPRSDAQLEWILAHEIGHHIAGHLEVMEADMERCRGRRDRRHYQLRRKLEFEADRSASDLLLKMAGPGYLHCADLLLSFMCFSDDLLDIKYDHSSTHPSAVSRLKEFRRHMRNLGIPTHASSERWERYLQEVAKYSKRQRRADAIGLRLELPPGFTS